MSGRPVCLVVLDGWGLAEPGPGNAVERADTPVFDDLWARYPHARLRTSGEDVGLPAGQMGNSEVGHLNLGAGAIVPQDLARIDAAVQDGSFASNEVLEAWAGGGERLHVIGLVSEGGVHSAARHLRALIHLVSGREGVELIIHAFTDGRDTSPTAGADTLATVEQWCREAGNARVGTVAGRYFAMDRDERWDRTQKAYDLLVHGRGDHHAESAEAAVRGAYERDETDEFITPTTVGDEACIRAGDPVLGLNFRPDRMRQITRALAEPDFGEIDRGGAEPVRHYATMTAYEADWTYPVAFPPLRPETTIGSVVADAGLAQLHVAETEKYPHVTYFFNGGREQPYEGEIRELVPSPRDVPTYDHKPEMSAQEATEAFLARFAEGPPAFSIINFANPDMVGHTGDIDAAVRAVETVDACLGRVAEAVREAGGVLLVTADHGNADHMLDEDGSVNTAHSLNPVPFVVTDDGVTLREEGILADVAPTCLQLLGIEQPEAMTGESMLTGG